MAVASNTGFSVAVYDNAYNLLGFVSDYASCSVEFRDHDISAGTLVVDGNRPMSARLMQASDDTVPVTVQVGTRRWSGRVAQAVSTGATGEKVVTATLESDYAYLHTMLAWPQPGLGIGAQIPSHDVRLGACETQVKAYISAAAARMNVPVAVVHPPSPDPSAFVSMSARMTPIDTLISASLTTARMGMSVRMWLPKDPLTGVPDPQPPGLTLSAPTLVVDMIRAQNKDYIQWDDRLGHIITATTTVKAARSAIAITGGKSNSWLDNTFPALPRDAFLAFDQVADGNRLTALGPFAYRETFTSAGAGAFSVDAGIAAATQLHKDRGTKAVVATVADGAPWSFGTDYNEADIVGLHVDGVDYRQNVTLVTCAHDRSNGVSITPTVGDTTIQEDPIVQLYNRVKELFAVIATFTLGA
jgi:hypothetical protein